MCSSWSCRSMPDRRLATRFEVGESSSASEDHCVDYWRAVQFLERSHK